MHIHGISMSTLSAAHRTGARSSRHTEARTAHATRDARNTRHARPRTPHGRAQLAGARATHATQGRAQPHGRALTTSNLRARAAHYVFSRTHRLRSRSFANWASPQNDAADLSLPVRTMLAATEDLSRVIRGRANFWCWLENSKMLGSVIFGPMIFR